MPCTFLNDTESEFWNYCQSAVLIKLLNTDSEPIRIQWEERMNECLNDCYASECFKEMTDRSKVYRK